MTDYYLDTSALVKRYADEAGSNWIRQITEANAENTILLAAAMAENLLADNPLDHS